MRKSTSRSKIDGSTKGLDAVCPARRGVWGLGFGVVALGLGGTY